MALQDVFLAPIGLAALLVAVPIVILYLIRPDPERLELPTFRFLVERERQRATTPLLERLSRSLLLLLQLLVVVLLAVSLAAPYVAVSERVAVEETVLVVDTSASMATTEGDESRFEGALATAREEVTPTTSVVSTAGDGEVLLQRGPPSEARSALDGLEATDAPGNLRRAIEQASVLAGEDARIVVVSDFAGDDWIDAAASARAQGISVDLRQFDRGGGANVGFVDRRFSGSTVTLSLKNFGEEPVTRTVGLGDRREELRLGAGDVVSVTLPVPAGGGEARLTPGDDFAVDDSVYVAAPPEAAIDVLVLTNDRNRYLTTALSVIEQVDVTVAAPPTTIDDGYDVIVYSNVDPESLLPGNVETGRELVADGGGVAVQAQERFPERYGDLSLIEPAEVRTEPTVGRRAETGLTRGIDFQPPGAYLAGSLREGEALVTLDDGSPLLATAERDGGRLLYYGYIEERSTFKFNYLYPVFWKRAVFELADRRTLPALNYETGETARLGSDSGPGAVTVDGPEGRLEGPSVRLRRAGFYATDERRVSASLLDEAESDTGVEPLADRSGPAGKVASEEPRQVPRPLTEYVAVAALLVVVLEVAYLRRRGDL